MGHRCIVQSLIQFKSNLGDESFGGDMLSFARARHIGDGCLTLDKSLWVYLGGNTAANHLEVKTASL